MRYNAIPTIFQQSTFFSVGPSPNNLFMNIYHTSVALIEPFQWKSKITISWAKIGRKNENEWSIKNVLKEVGWVPLSDRRKIQKYVFIYKEKHSLLPEYLHEIFPGTVQEISDNQYALRNNESYASVASRTEVYAKSVIPSSLSLWNNLDANNFLLDQLIP